MHSRRALRPFLLTLLLAAATLCGPPPAHGQETTPPPDAAEGPNQPTLDVSRVHLIGNDAILRMHNAGLGDDVLFQTIQLQPGHYDTNPDDLIALKSAGLSDRVIAAMQAHNAGLGLHVVHGPASLVPPAPLAAGIDEIGVYYKSKTGDWILLKVERVEFKSGGAAKSILTHGIISKDMNGHIDGPKSPLVLPPGVQILIYAPAGTDGEEYDFLRFHQHSDNREFRVQTGGVFHSETGDTRDELDFHPTKIGPQMFTLTIPADLSKGEYGVLPPGSANVRGLAGTGKIFTFSIVE